jgi:hypothetical protein
MRSSRGRLARVSSMVTRRMRRRRTATRWGWREAGDDVVGVAGEGAGDPADALEVVDGDLAGDGVAGLPQLGEGELHEREAALGAGGDELLDQGLGVEVDALQARRADDRLAHALGESGVKR